MSNRATTQRKIDAHVERIKSKHPRTTPATTKPQTTKSHTTNEGELPRFDLGTLPNHLNRSSFIAPIGRGKREKYHLHELPSRCDCTIIYSGEQLDEADGDILMALLYLNQGKSIDQPMKLNRSKILKLLHRETGRAQYNWLLRRIESISASRFLVKTEKYTAGQFNIIDFIHDHKSGDYLFAIDKEWTKLFSNREISRIDWEKRMSIGRQLNMAKAFQRLIATDSSKLQHYEIQRLKEIFVYTGRMRDFIDALNRNISELKRLGIIEKWKIGKNTKGNQQLTLHINKISCRTD